MVLHKFRGSCVERVENKFSVNFHVKAYKLFFHWLLLLEFKKHVWMSRKLTGYWLSFCSLLGCLCAVLPDFQIQHHAFFVAFIVVTLPSLSLCARTPIISWNVKIVTVPLFTKQIFAGMISIWYKREEGLSFSRIYPQLPDCVDLTRM